MILVCPLPAGREGLLAEPNQESPPLVTGPTEQHPAPISKAPRGFIQAQGEKNLLWERVLEA